MHEAIGSLTNTQNHLTSVESAGTRQKLVTTEMASESQEHGQSYR